MIDGLHVPFLGLDSLIASKETHPEQDRQDILRLRELREQAHHSGPE